MSFIPHLFAKFRHPCIPVHQTRNIYLLTFDYYFSIALIEIFFLFKKKSGKFDGINAGSQSSTVYLASHIW